MTNAQFSRSANEPGIADYVTAAHEVLATLLVRMSPKRERKAREEIERYIATLKKAESLPDNVVPLRGRIGDLVEERRLRLRLAAAVRIIAEPVGAKDYVAEAGQ